MDIIGTILWPIKWVVELILVAFHWLFSAMGLDPAAGLTWVLAIVGLTVVVRAALIPIFVRQIKNQRRMLEIAPQLKKIQDKYKGKKDQFSREAMSRETMALYKETGTNPLSSCLPLLIQMPIFFSLYSVLHEAQINKTDRNDARGIAQMMRAGLYRPVHVKTLRSQKLRMLLTHRKLLQSKAIAIDNDLRGTLRNFGLKVGVVGAVKFEARIMELVENLPDLAELVEPLLVVRRVLREQFIIQHRRLLAIVRDDEVCRRLMTVPGVGPVVSLTYRATVDVPARFQKSKSVGAVFGLTCAKYQSGEVEWSGRISRCGDEMMRAMLYEAAQSMLRSKKWSWLKAWAMQIARRRGMKKAIVALARRLGVIMHRIWVDGTEFRWTREAAAA